MICILGIETSYDDTAIAIYDSVNGILLNKIITHDKINIKYGGNVPNLSSKYHLNNLLILLKDIINNNLIKKIDFISYTAGPGLSGSLIIGASIAGALSLAYKKPLIPINHLEAHLLSPFINKKNILTYPFLGLLISGGNTLLVYSPTLFYYKIIGKTKDDSLGEIIDKIGKKLELDYPWGKSLSKIAKLGNKKRFIFPKPMIKKKNLDFSFSGLKTAVINTINKQSKPLNFLLKADIAKSFFLTIIDTIILKCIWALEKIKTNLLIICGGVSKNILLRKYINKFFKINNNKLKIIFPNKKLCTDNAVMIAFLSYLKIKYEKNIILSSINKDIYIFTKKII